MAGGRIVVVGGVNTDLVVWTERLPRPGETVQGQRFTIAGGGKGANAAVAAARLGAMVGLIACVGEDAFGQARLAELAAEGIDLRETRRSDAAASGVALIAVDALGENSIVVAPGSNALLSPAMVTVRPLAAADLLLTQLEVPLPTVEAALRQARTAGARTILNAAPLVPEALSLLPLTDVLIVNEVEAADLLGWEQVTPERAAEAATAILAQGPATTAITLGAHGAMVGQGKRRQHLPAPPVTVVDTTAAGDAFTGALAASLLAGQDLFVAAERAVIAGALTVTRAGAQPSLPTASDLERFGAG